METCMVTNSMTAYRKLPPPYPTVPSLIYLPFSYNIFKTDRRTTTIPIARPLLKYGRLKIWQPCATINDAVNSYLLPYWPWPILVCL